MPRVTSYTHTHTHTKTHRVLNGTCFIVHPFATDWPWYAPADAIWTISLSPWDETEWQLGARQRPRHTQSQTYPIYAVHLLVTSQLTPVTQGWWFNSCAVLSNGNIRHVHHCIRIRLTYLVILASFQELNGLPIHVSEHVLSCVILKLFKKKNRHPECSVVFSTGPFQISDFPPGS